MTRTIAGNNFYLIKSYVRKIKRDFIAKNGDMSVEEIDCEEIETGVLVGALQSSPLFSKKKLIIAKNIAQNKKLAEQIQRIFEAAEDANELIIVEKDIDKRSVYYKFLKKNSDFTECGEPNEDQLVEWLCKEAKDIGASLSRQDARYLLNHTGINQQLLENELNKLAAYDKNITKESIDGLTAEKPQSSIFNLLDSAFAGNIKVSLRIYEEQKAQGAQPQSIFGMVIWQANILATVAAKSGMSPKELSDITGVKPFLINKAYNIYKRIGRGGVDSLLDKLTAADKQMKTQSADPDEVLKNLLVTIS